jgi:hypothetical protein
MNQETRVEIAMTFQDLVDSPVITNVDDLVRQATRNLEQAVKEIPIR